MADGLPEMEFLACVPLSWPYPLSPASLPLKPEPSCFSAALCARILSARSRCSEESLLRKCLGVSVAWFSVMLHFKMVVVSDLSNNHVK